MERYETKGGQSRKVTPKQRAFETYYNDPKSPTYCNAKQSAIKAGYTEQYANSITAQHPDWLNKGDNLRAEMLERAELNLKAITEMDEEQLKNPQFAKIWQDTNKFISERLGKEYYSSRQEVTGKDGRRIFDEVDKESTSIPLKSLFKTSEKAK
jgi:hypothetical protein